jgi:hypothetical protein
MLLHILNKNIKIMDFETKDSKERVRFSTGMQRDTSKDKPRFDLITPLDLPYKEQMLTRWAELMARGAKNYTARNWEKAATQEELDRFIESASRHFAQWVAGETDEDHSVAVFFNISGAEYVKWKLKQDKAHFPLTEKETTQFTEIDFENTSRA